MKYDLEGMKNFLVLHPDYFCDENEVHDIGDIIFFKIRESKNMVFYGEYFICDIYGNELWIVELLEKPLFNKKRQQKLRIKPIAKILEDCQQHFHRFNGYWKIPEGFERED